MRPAPHGLEASTERPAQIRYAAVVLALVAGLLTVPTAAAGAGAAGGPFPTAISLPDGFFPEGIAINGQTAYVGSLVDGSVREQDLRTGEVRTFASPVDGTIAVGMDVDAWGRLWVAGGGPALDPSISPGFRVYETGTGALVLEASVAAGFVNDVIVTRDAAWFTDSFAPQLIRVPLEADGTIGTPEYVALAGDWEQAAGFNANGIVAAANEQYLVVAQSTAPDGPGAALYRVPADPAASSLEAVRIELNGILAGADGLVLNGNTLYSVAGGPGVVKIKLSEELTQGRIIETLAVPDSLTPTTAALRGSRLYVVDAKFPLFGDPTVPFQTTAIRR